VGIAAGLLLFISLSNLLTQVVPVQVAFWCAALTVFSLGLVAAAVMRRDVRLPGAADVPYAALFVGVLFVSVSINRGLGILDDYHNLPLVSVMGAGRMPPDFYLNTSFEYAYHYGLHVAAASLVSLGGFTPWGAFDLSKAFTLALAVPLAALLVRRVTSHTGWVAFGTAVFALLGGTRWLLLLAPASWVDAVGARLTLLGSLAETGSTLPEVLLLPWAAAGSGPLPFPAAYLSGLRAPATHVVLGGSALLPEVTLLLLLLLHRREWRPASAALFAVLMSTLALSSEILFLVAVGALSTGLLLGWILGPRRGWSRPRTIPVVAILGLSLALALVQGGVLTALARRLIDPSIRVYGFAGLSFAWPPRLVSAHLGNLRVDDPGQLLLAAIEAGPAILLLPLALAWSWQHLRRGMSFTGGLGPVTLLLAVAGLFLQYEILRETSRFPANALMVWTVFGLQPLILFLRGGRGWARVALVVCLMLGMFGGVVLLATQLVAAAKPTRSYFVGYQDSLMANLYWDRLDSEAMVFDPNPYRSVTLFGRPSRSHQSYWEITPAFGRLIRGASPREIARAGYGYIYMDDAWWAVLSTEQRAGFAAECAAVVHEEVGPPDKFRILYDVRTCSPGGSVGS
jgi:hypothetical protein